MAGFFRNFSNKNGKGVSKDEPDKNRFFLFFEILWRKLWQVIGVNILYFIIILPLLSYVTIIVLNAVGITSADVTENTLLMIFGYILNLRAEFMWLLIGGSAILYGPATCGLTYILRNYTRQEHAWTFSDFFERAKTNFKQGVLFGFIDIALLLSCSMWLSMDVAGSWYLFLFRSIALIVFILYFVMRFYIYTLIVTFNMSFRAILKNAWIFVVLGFFRNILTLLLVALTLATSIASYALAFLAFLTFAFGRFIAVYNTYPIIDRYMLQPMKRKEQESSEGSGIELLEESVFSDTLRDTSDSSKQE